MKALLVDDSEVMRKVIGEALSKCGFAEVVHATDGQQTLDLTGQHEFALAVIDWDLPRMSGVDTVRALREQGRGLPVIIVAEEGARDRVIEALKSGATGFVIKPFDTATFEAKVKSVLALASPQMAQE